MRLTSAAEIRAEAMAGEPFGVAEISFPVDATCTLAWHCRSIHLDEASGRILYPVLDHAGLLQRLASALDGTVPEAPARASISFLFVGDEPLEITLHGSQKYKLTVVPRANRPAKHGRMTRAWWNKVWGPVGERMNDASRPRPVENYVAGMGLWRLGLNRHPARHPTSAGTLEEMVIGTARMRADMSRAVSFGWSDRGVADRPLLPPLHWQTVQLPVVEDVDIEEIAYRVPENCFYLRFARFTNMLWVLRMLESHGEELQRLVTTRGFRADAGEKIKSQLAIAELPFADLIGDRLIDDVALIGRDLFLTDGAAVGVILRVKNPLFTSGLKGVRRTAVEKFEKAGARETTVEIEGKKVSLIATPDNQLRSFHVIDGNWHLLTNSSSMAASFLRTGKKKERSLADVPAFQRLRTELPPDRSDTLFAYVSTAFLKSFTHPEYVIELQRRVRARAELAALQVAFHAAEAELRAFDGAGVALPAGTGDVVADLKARGMLPPGFGERADGSQPLWRDGNLMDSLRGGVGYFTPVPDMKVNAATAEENRVYQRFVNAHTGQWGALDPLMVRLRKTPIKERPGRDRLEIDARVSPLQEGNASILLGVLGNHRRERMTPHEDALVTAEAMISSKWVPTRMDTHSQLMILEGPRVEPIYRARLADFVALAQRTPMRLLVEPAGSAFDRRWWRAAVPTAQGEFYYGPFKLIGRRMADHAAISFDQKQLLDVPTRINWERLEKPAQAWVHVGDLEGSSIEDAVTALAAVRAMSGSVKNAKFFHQWTELLGLPPERGYELTRNLVGMDPVCPLGGEYKLVDHNGHKRWRSTKWGDDSMLPEDLKEFYPSLLRWCHGLDAAVDVGKNGLQLTATVEVAFAERDEELSKEDAKPAAGDEDQRPAKPGFKLPSIFGGGKK